MRTSSGVSVAASACWLSLLLSAAAAPRAAGATLPWEVWKDLRQLAVLGAGGQVVLRSSHCPSGCAADRHAPGDSRFLRLEGEEGVLLDEAGPGALTRIWMTTGATVSQPFDPAVRVRFYFDGEALPRIDLPLPDLFSGAAPPFTPPLVADRLSSSGGFVSYVPMPFAERLKVTVSNAPALRLWFQFNIHRLAPGPVVTSFTGREDLAALRTLLASFGGDPWPARSDATLASGTTTVAAGGKVVLDSAARAGTVTGILLGASPAVWESVHLVLRFDGETLVEMPLADFFAVRAETELDTRSLFLGRNAAGVLYSYFPMPFASSFELALRNEGRRPAKLTFAVRRDRRPPLGGSGRFAAQLRAAEPWPPGADFLVAYASRPGTWVGLTARLASVGTSERKYLEGDERVYVDGAPAPALYGTGIEDLANGGFYFDQGPFVQALAGMTDQRRVSPGREETAFYRFFLTDAVPFQRSLVAGLEPGSSGELAMAARTVSYLYLGSPPERLARAGRSTARCLRTSVSLETRQIFESRSSCCMVKPSSGAAKSRSPSASVARGSQRGSASDSAAQAITAT